MGMAALMNNSIEVQIQVIKFDAVGVGEGSIDVLLEQLFFQRIGVAFFAGLMDLGEVLHQPSSNLIKIMIVFGRRKMNKRALEGRQRLGVKRR